MNVTKKIAHIHVLKMVVVLKDFQNLLLKRLNYQKMVILYIGEEIKHKEVIYMYKIIE